MNCFYVDNASGFSVRHGILPLAKSSFSMGFPMVSVFCRLASDVLRCLSWLFKSVVFHEKTICVLGLKCVQLFFSMDFRLISSASTSGQGMRGPA